MVELRKRKTPPPAPAPAPKKERKTKTTKANDKEKVAEAAPEAPKPEPAVADPSDIKATEPTSGPPKTGDTIDIEGFGGDFETNDGRKVTFKTLLDESKAGVVLFTYPKASTPGCTTQVCLFRDSYTPLTATGLSIFGLSSDSPKANTTFQTKQNLPYPLLCDPSSSLIEAIGMKKSPKGTQRGVFVVKKDGVVLAAEAGGPAATVEVVKALVEKMDGPGISKEVEEKAIQAEKEETETGEDGEPAAKL